MTLAAEPASHITVTALKWAPPFAQGNVRDHRIRWVLNEVGWPYEVKLVDAPTMKSAGYRSSLQPFVHDDNVTIGDADCEAMIEVWFSSNELTFCYFLANMTHLDARPALDLRRISILSRSRFIQPLQLLEDST